MFATTSDGVRLALRRYPVAAAQRRAVLLCTHAMMAHGRYFERGFAQHLAGRGVQTYVLDWRGHGRSVPPSPRSQRWSFEHYVARDLPAALVAVAADAQVAVSDLCYLGHSLGGLVGLAAFSTGTAPVPRRLSLWATSVWLPGPRGPLRRRVVMKAYDWLSRPLGYAPIRSLRLGSEDEQRGYVQQLAGWAARGSWPYDDLLHRIDTPTWAVTGVGDRLSSSGDTHRLLGQLPQLAPLRVVGRASGDLLDPDHFSLFTSGALAPLWSELVEFVS